MARPVRYSIELRTGETTSQVIEKISANTARELVPFVSSTVQTGALGEKSFVSSASGNRFRLWCVPYTGRKRPRSHRYLRGEVTDLNGERHILGSFAPHPFQIIFALVPFVFAAVVWAWGDPSIPRWIFIGLPCALGLAMIGETMRPRPKEESEILWFLRRLFPDSHFDVHVQ